MQPSEKLAAAGGMTRTFYLHTFSSHAGASRLAAACVVAFASLTTRAEAVDFRRDVQPILANHCLSCHGVDETSRQAELRLDLRDGATAINSSGHAAIVPGSPERSELVRRILAEDAEAMPPEEAKRPLTAAQKQTLQRWIAEGAIYAEHWAFARPERPDIPSTSRPEWVRNPIDTFVLERLEEQQLAPAPDADRSTWLRRVSFDLTGISPSPRELASFLADRSPTAYADVVDRLLESPRHAERMAMLWLDAARYADTNGYNNDEERPMWPWRNWVIDAFAKGMPYDQFVTEQLAGDLLPEPTLSQRIATGFNRNHVLTTEGGIIEEEYQCEYVADRVHTASTVLLALSIQCARCHDHKFDPISQREFYQFAAFFNNISDKLTANGKQRMAEPVLKAPSPEQAEELARHQARLEEVEQSLAARAAMADELVAAWEAQLAEAERKLLEPPGIVAHFAFDESDGEPIVNSIDASVSGAVHGTTTRVEGKSGRALNFDGNTRVVAAEAGRLKKKQPLSMAISLRNSSNALSTLVTLNHADDNGERLGFDVQLEQGKIAVRLVEHSPDRTMTVKTKAPVSLEDWRALAIAYDGSSKPEGLALFVDGQRVDVDVSTTDASPPDAATGLTIGGNADSASFHGLIDDFQLYDKALTAEEAAALAAGTRIAGISALLAKRLEERSESERTAVRTFYLNHADEPHRAAAAEKKQIADAIAALDAAIPLTMVMSEMTSKRPTYVLKRGQYDQPGEEVAAGVPQALLALPQGAPANRLGLAQWLVHPDHPLTARVAVNRWWEMFFGIGLVETTEDFGVQGAQPTHPELLDWLATELVRSGWNQRHILRLIALSGTYRQSSHATPQALENDPRNTWLARGPRYRLPAEMVRDNALAVSGLLAEIVGGPSVRPYQPAGLWEDVSVLRRESYVPDSGTGRVRRSMYTFWKRTCPPPGMATFDAPDRETCVVRRARTNTPLQALALMNDPIYVEAGRKLAESVLAEEGLDAARLDFSARLVLTRNLKPEELVLLEKVLDQARRHFRSHPEAADSLLSVGQSPRSIDCDPVELAAWTSVMNLMLNLDEAISKT